MKSRYAIATAALICLALTSCGKNEEAAQAGAPAIAPTGYSATFAEGIQFAAKPDYPLFIKAVSGMSGYETAGRWTEGPTAAFTFTQALPASFTLKLDLAGAFGPNAGKEVKVRVGDWEGKFVADVGPKVYELAVTTKSSTDTIVLAIPEPKSPKELLGGSDPRLLGVMLKNISIVTN